MAPSSDWTFWETRTPFRARLSRLLSLHLWRTLPPRSCWKFPRIPPCFCWWKRASGGPSGPAFNKTYFGDTVTIGPKAALLVAAKGHSDDFVLAHQKLWVSKRFPQSLEVIGGHVLEGKHVNVLEPVCALLTMNSLWSRVFGFTFVRETNLFLLDYGINN